MADAKLRALFERFRAHGDLDALAAVFDRAAPELLKVARHLSRDEAEAEDLVQATFLAAIEHPERFDADRELVPWMVGILANKARAAREAGSRAPDPRRLPAAKSEDPESDAELREFMSALEKALDRVPAAYRQVLRIHLAEGKSPEEIARELDRNASTVRTQLHRGLKDLRRKLPAGLALGGVVLVAAPRGLADVRAQVLETAGSLTGAGSGGLAAAGITGGVVMGKKIALLTGTVLLASGSWLFLRARAIEPADETAVVREPPVRLAESPDRAESSDATEPPPTEKRASLATNSENVDEQGEPYGALDVECAWVDGTPAPGIGVLASPQGELIPSDHSLYGFADDRGHVSFERLREGVVKLYADRGCNLESSTLPAT